MSSHVVARVRHVRFADGSVSHVDLVRSDEPAPEAQVFAAMVILTDADGRYAVVFSPRRGEWGPPGGGRELGETVVECVLREVREETGLLLSADALVPCGFEQFDPQTAGRWPPEGGSIQLFRARIASSAPDLLATEPDAVDPQWVGLEDFRRRAGDRFWWPLIEDGPPSGSPARRPG
jgi:8-oxo-dGTP pyrophosphatase MutT (NUDIX family)